MHKSVLWIAVLFLGCVSSPYPIEYISLNGRWLAQDPLVFKVEESALETPHNLYFHIRNNNAYAYSNIFLIARLKDSTQVYATDTLEYAMTDLQGKWLGKGFGEVKESVLWWKQNMVLKGAGPLSVELDHAMRNYGEARGIKALEGIVAVGLGISPAEKN